MPYFIVDVIWMYNREKYEWIKSLMLIVSFAVEFYRGRYSHFRKITEAFSVSVCEEAILRDRPKQCDQIPNILRLKHLSKLDPYQHGGSILFCFMDEFSKFWVIQSLPPKVTNTNTHWHVQSQSPRCVEYDKRSPVFISTTPVGGRPTIASLAELKCLLLCV